MAKSRRRQKVAEQFAELGLAMRLMPTRLCPSCGHTLSAVSTEDIGRTTPRPADRTICIACRVVLVFTETMTLRIQTAAEWDALSRSEQRECYRILRMITAVGVVRDDAGRPQ